MTAEKLDIYQGMSIIGLHSPVTLETSKESSTIMGWGGNSSFAP